MRKVLQYYKKLPANEFHQLFHKISVFEYFLWWLLRVGMIIGVTRLFLSEQEPLIFCLTVLGNLAMTFSVVLFRLIFPKSFFLGRLPYTTQRYINISVLAGSFFGHIIPLYHIPNYDKILHYIGGFFIVFIGYDLMRCMKHDNRPVSPFISSLGGFGFSCFLVIGWEIFEFFADYYIAGSNNQGYNIPLNPNNNLYKIFGTGALNEGQIAVHDTMFDMIIGLVGAIFGAMALRLYVSRLNEKRLKKPLSIDELRWERAKEPKDNLMIM